MKLSDLALEGCSNLIKQKGRSLITIIAIVIGSYTIALTIGANTGINDYLNKQVQEIGPSNKATITLSSGLEDISSLAKFEPVVYDPESRVSGTNNLIEFFSKEEIERIENLDSVEAIHPYLSLPTEYIKGDSGNKYAFSAINHGGNNIDLVVGHEVDSNSSDYQINIAPEYIESLGFDSPDKAVGEVVSLAISSQVTAEQSIIDATIVGVRKKSLFNNGQSIVNQSLANKIVEINEEGLPENLKDNYFILYATVGKDYLDNNMKSFKEEIDELGFRALSTKDEFEMFQQIVNAITGIITLFACIGLIAASFGVINTLYMSVQDRTRQIGLMKAIGLSRFRVFILFSLEALMLGLTGGGIGLLLAYTTGNVVNNYANKSFLADLDGFFLFQFSVKSTFTILTIILLVTFLAGTFPANKASKLNPIIALKHE